MDETEISTLMSQQETVGQELERMMINYKKDSITRKTPEYLQKKLEKLDDLWTAFQANHTRLKQYSDQYAAHAYFNNQYFEEASKFYQQLKTSITELTAKHAIGSNLQLPSASVPHNRSSFQFNAQPGPDEDGESPVANQVKKQKVLMTTLSHFLQDIEDKLKEPQSRAYLDVKINLLNQHVNELRKNNQKIWENTNDDQPHGYTKELYFEQEDWLQEVLVRLQEGLQGSTSCPQNSQVTSITSQLKLPKLIIPRFDGNYLKWMCFRDLYVQLIHYQPINNVEKMYYLTGHLVGEPYNLIKHLSISNESYEAAWDIICSRYENKRLLVTAVLNKLLSHPNCHHESSSAIKALHDNTKECLMSLENLGISVETWDPILIHLILKKLDKDTHTLYEQSLQAPRELNSMQNVLQFLEKRFQALETLSGKSTNRDAISTKPHYPPGHKGPATLAAVASRTTQCIMCKTNHPLFACATFLAKSPTERLNWLFEHKLCINCMQKGHNATRCTLRSCKKCAKRHNTLVHIEPTIRSSNTKTNDAQPTTGNNDYHQSLAVQVDQTSTSEPTKAQSNPVDKAHVLLGTVKVKVVTHDGKEIECRAILDSGSQLNFVTKQLAKRLKLQETCDPLNIAGIGHSKQPVQNKINITLKSHTTGYTTNLEAYILQQITNYQPPTSINTSTWTIPKNLKLADPDFYQPNKIDLLIGAEQYYQLLAVGQIQLGQNLPILQNTVLGWIVAGKATGTTSSDEFVSGICVHENPNNEVELMQLLEKFWKLEEIAGPNPNLSLAEKNCETHFNLNTKRDSSGRFVVKLPFAMNPSMLGESKQMALSRLFSMEKKFKRNPDIKHQYTSFMNEYLELGHMTEVDIHNLSEPHYFLPHHCVLKPDSTTTKLRVVFDGSAKTSSNKSLNDILHTGPKIQAELFSILIRFRLPRYVFTADIEKMYRQVITDPEDRKYQLIAWRDDQNKPVKFYQLNTVTYGISAAPYLAIKSLKQLATQEAERFPLGAYSIKHELYVDDAMAGADTLQEALDKQSQLDYVLKSAGFKLRKWCANHQKLLENIPVQDRSVQTQLHDDECPVKTLGITWISKTDEFQITTRELKGDIRVTKRQVLSDIAHLFDPLGILAPVIVTAKIFLQRLWTLKLDWDQAVPQDLHTKWNQFRQALTDLNKIRIPRHVASLKKVVNQQLHVFCDASELAYGCAVYIRSTLQDGSILVRLLCAKSRVAPTKKTTLPRLELCAAQLGAQFLHRVKSDLNWQEACYCWTDSEIVLAWIQATSASYHTFVANRIALIQELTIPDQWRHVSGKVNPADLVSRGISPDKLQNCHLWFYGPLFLHGAESSWPVKLKAQTTDLERKTSTAVLTATSCSFSIFNQINHRNSFMFLVRVVAYILRFTQNCRTHKTTGELKVQELENALIILLKEIQQQEFSEDLRALQKTKWVNSTSALISLSPFLDERGIMRVGGRLEESCLSYDAKHPMLLPYAHVLTRMIFVYYHLQNSHAGPQALLSIVRQRFWPVKGKTLARAVVKNCVTCHRTRPQLLGQFMGNLPTPRVQPARPFVNTGVDFCGPFWTHYKIRGKRPVKTYVAIFCCFATKAVHIEVVSDLTTEAFIGSLKRFLARRGHCKNLYCDNATNFVGAHNQLKELETTIYSEKANEKIAKFCVTKGIDFQFIPPRSPHFGGLWEAAVKSAKNLFYKGVAAASLTYEELETTMIEIESILNSRPLTPMSTDPNDLTALTPGHFLIGEPLTSLIDPHAEPVKGNLLYRWKLVSHLKNEFWHRWTKEYLSELQHRYKWNKPQANVKLGTLVLIKEDNAPVLSWPLGRIIQTIKGKDGLVRVADIKTAAGILRRPIHKLAPLPLEDNTDQGNTDTNDQDSPDDKAKPQSPTNKRRFTSQPQNSRQPSTSGEGTEPSSNKKRCKTTSTLKTILLACLLMPLMVTADVRITPFSTPPGLYFEDLGPTYLAPNEWDLVVFFDMKAYWLESKFLVNATEQLNRICNTAFEKQLCTDTVSQFHVLINEIQNSNEILAPQKRIRRAPLNLIGNVASALFGVLDSDYAEQMTGIIDNMEDRQDQLLALIRNQTSVIDSTTNIMRNIQTTTENQIHELSAHLNRTTKAINDIRTELQAQKTSEVFTAFAVRLLLSITNYQRIQSALIDVVIDTHHGKISPLLLSPSQLRSQLSVIKDNLPPSLHLPNIRSGILELYSLMTVEYRITTTNIIFRVKLPLLSHEAFQLLNVVPVPAIFNDTYITIEPTTKYLVVDLHRDSYYPLTHQELLRCHVLGKMVNICKQNHPIFKRGAEISSCEINMLIQSSLPSSCKISSSTQARRWTPLQNPNHWLYAVNKATSINTFCGSKVSQRILEGSGIITISKDCILKDESTTIQGHNNYESTIRTAIIPTKSFIDLLPPTQIDKLSYVPVPQTNITHAIIELKKKIEAMKTQENFSQQPTNHQIHHFSIGYTSLSLIILIIMYLLWKCHILRRNSSPPIPAPRHSVGDFRFGSVLELNSRTVQGGENVQNNTQA